MHVLTPLAEMMLPERVSDRRDARTYARSMLSQEAIPHLFDAGRTVR